MTSQAAPYTARRAREKAAASDVAGGPRIVPLLFFSVLVVAIFFAMIYLRIAMDRSAFELDSVNDQITLEQSRTLDLRLELAQLQDPQRIAAQAAEIGLVYPESQITLVVTGERERADYRGDETPLDAFEAPTP
jgi:cell division protein FtsL